MQSQVVPTCFLKLEIRNTPVQKVGQSGSGLRQKTTEAEEAHCGLAQLCRPSEVNASQLWLHNIHNVLLHHATELVVYHGLSQRCLHHNSSCFRWSLQWNLRLMFGGC